MDARLMEQHYLHPLFEPKAVAVVGASEREHSVGGTLVRNMLAAGYRGKLFAVNPKYAEVAGVACYPSVEDVPQRLDLAVIATPARTVPDVIRSCGRAGVRSAVIVSAGFSETGRRGALLERQVLENARQYNVRIVGPNCLGVMRPELGLDATFANGGAQRGSVALVSQSGALCAAILDWAKSNDVGFSSVISMGGSIDVDFGEIVDYLAHDPRTESILLYIEGIRHARRFMSALRLAARIKPVVLLKVGKHAVGSKAALSHTGSLVGTDDVFDSAIRRAGAVRVSTIGQLFASAQALASHLRPRGNRLAIITNGGGPGVMAADHAADLGIPLADLAPKTIEEINKAMPPNWSHSNPLDVIGDADPGRYRAALAACLADEGVDGILTILTPQAVTDAMEAARAVADLAKESDKPVVACWMGEEQVAPARKLLQEAGIPNFRTPEPAVELFSHISAYYRNQKLLLQTPGPLSHYTPPDVEGARLIVETALSEGRRVLNEMESKALLAAFHVPIARTVIARSPTEAMLIAQEIGMPVAMKVDSPDITHKTDAGGVRLNLTTTQSVRTAYQELLDEVKRNRPTARIAGIAIEPMIKMPNGRELMLGVMRDPVFGPAITFGGGGMAVEIHADRAVALPPLNSYLVRDMVRSTKVSKLLGEFRNMPPINLEALERVLLRISEMVCELPWIHEMDINPLIVDEHQAVAVDARIILGNKVANTDDYGHMAIHPYPTNLTQQWQLPDGNMVTLRPIRPEDAEMEREFVRNLSAESRYFRFMDTIRELTQPMLVRFTQIDYDREMAFVAVVEREGKDVQVGVARYVSNPDGESCEFAVVVSDDMQGKGLGRKLMGNLIAVARDRGLKTMVGSILSSNSGMLRMMESLGFAISTSEEDNAVKLATLPM